MIVQCMIAVLISNESNKLAYSVRDVKFSEIKQKFIFNKIFNELIDINSTLHLKRHTGAYNQ